MTPFLWALLTAFTWGCVPILEKTGLGRIDALTGLFYRSLGVLLGGIILIVFKWSDIKQVFSTTQNTWGYLVIGGFLASFVGQLFFYNALKGDEASRVVPLAAIYPLVSFVLGVIFLSEKVTLAKIGGIGFVLAGVFLLK